MKKTLRTILAGALALLAVSCYDDSELRGKVGKLDERVTALEAKLNAEVGGLNDLATRLAAAEAGITTLNGNVTTFTSQITGILTRLDAVDGAADGKIKNLEDAIAALQAADVKFNTDLAAAAAKIAVTKVEEVNGVVELTLADGSKVALSKPLSNVENSGLVTVVETEEGKFWAVVEADGTKTSLEVPVGHPDVDIEFQVSAEGELQYSVNGGEFVATGVTTSDLSGQEYLITDVEVAEGVVVITIGETVLSLPMYNPTPTVMIKSGKQFFEYSASKTVEVGVEGVETLQVMNQPYGWKASVKGGALTVTAPSETNTDAELSGVVVLHGDANGACVTAALNVAVGEGMVISVDEAGLVTLTNPIVAPITDYWGEVMGMGFGNAIVGYMPVDQFNSFSSMEELTTTLVYDSYGLDGAFSYLENVRENYAAQLEYDEEKYAVDTLTFTLEQFGANTWPMYEPVKGERYVIFAIPQDKQKAYPENAVYVYYEPVIVEPVAEVSFNDIALTVNTYGTDVVYAGLVEASMFEGEDATQTFDQYMEFGYGMGGPWKQFQQEGYFESIGQEVANGAEISLAELNYGDPLLPSSKYIVWLMPKKGSKAPAEYDYAKDFKPYVFEFTTADIVAGGAEATLEAGEMTYSSISVNVTPAEGTSTWYKFYEVGEIDEMNDVQLAIHVMSYGYPLYGTAAEETMLQDGTTMVLVVLSIDEEGKYALATQSYSTLSYPVVETITATVESVTKGEGKEYTAVIAVTGATKVALYSNYSASYTSFNKYLANKSTYMKYADVVDGKATVTFTASADYYYMCVAGFNENADGSVKEFSKYTSTQISSMLPAAE